MNKKIYLAISFVLVLFSAKSFCQTTLTLQPDSSTGNDAEIYSLGVSNLGKFPILLLNDWTFSGDEGVERGLLQFDISSIPAGVEVISAQLSLFNGDDSSQYNTGNNAFLIQRITSSWNQNTVLWSNQPTTTDTDEVSLPAATSEFQNYTNINVTNLVQDMVNKPSASFGFMLRLQNESLYNRICFASSKNSISANHPAISITYVPLSGCTAYFTSTSVGDSIHFHNYSSPGVAHALWNFGDSTTSTNLYPNTTFAHQYPTTGNYNVCLITSDSTGTCNDTFCSIVYACNIHAVLNYSKDGNVVTCTSNSTGASRVQWFFGDGSSDLTNSSNVTHAYLSTGQYVLVLKVYGDSTNQCYDSASVTIQITTSQTNLALQIDSSGQASEVWNLQPTTPYSTDLLRGNAWSWGGIPGLQRGYFNFNLSTLPQNAIITSALLSLHSPGPPNTQYDYNVDGSNSAWIRRVTGPWQKDSITWNNQPPSTIQNAVMLPASDSEYEDYLNIDVTQLVQDMENNPSTSFGFMLQLQNENIYRRLSFASSTFPDSTKHPQLVISYIQPSSCSAYFTANSKGDSVYFRNYVNPTGNITHANWNFGDSTASSNIYPSTTFSHHYTSTGDYTVCLVVGDSSGTCSDTFCRVVHACDIKAAFTYTLTGNKINCTSTSIGASQVNWSFGDASFDNGNHPSVSHSYALPGQYIILLQVLGDSSSSQCFDSTSIIISVTIPNPDTLSGIVFDDINGSGTLDSGEVGISNILVTLSDNNVSYINAVTDSSGHYQFIVGPGTWNISISYQSPWTETLPVGTTSYTVADTNGQNLSAFNFGLHNNLITISGTIFYDANDNGIQDPGELGVPYQYIQINGNWYFADAYGNYSITLPPGNYNVSYEPFITGYTLSVPDSGYYNVNAIASGQIYSGYNFGLWANPNLQDLAIYLSPYTNVARGFQTWYMIYFANYGANSANATITMNFDSSFIFVSADGSPSVDNINHVLTWYLDSLLPGENGYINCLFDVPQTLALGTSVLNWVSILPIVGDATPSDNIDSVYQVVEGSFDPNEKEVSPTGNVLPGQKMNYTVEFQNTGTAPAVNIVVIDTLSSNLDWTTFKTESASNPYTLQLSATGVVKWTFTNIELPDSSTSQSESIGFVKYSINAKSTLASGSKVTNFADVYFDFNTPVRTDTTRTIINENTISTDISSPDQSIAISLYPNPMDDYTYIFVGGQVNMDYKITIMDILGQKVKTLEGKTGESLKIDKGNMISGLYLYEVILDGKQVGVGKIAVK